MQVRDVMTSNPACCTPDTNLQEVARMMVEHDCGCIPVVENEQTMRPVGVITDRDIVSRTVAVGQNPLQMTAGHYMSSPVATVTPETSVDDCCRTMEENQVRRVPVVNERGGCCGMVAQADIAMHAPQEKTAEMVQEVSQPTPEASHVAAPQA
ncbi:MAG: CBS domain-containing protein [Caldilinea sp. CFX5]|nr:CBS domain-containing protein [Caldilinea sp. CFX5]